jgi:SIR2-like domain
VAGSTTPPEPTRSQEHARAVACLTSLFEVSQSARPVFLLGAGASYRSGVPLAADATHRIAREAYARQRLGTNAVATVKPSDYMRFLRQLPWFIRGVDAFGENFPLSVQHLLTPESYRRDFFSRELRAHNDLSDGYISLARLAQRGLWRVLLTTNFDACCVEALGRLSPHVRRPVEFDLDEAQAGAFDIYSPHPQVVYLHGRVETYTARNTPEEVASLPQWLSTMLSPVLSASPIVIVGYRGAEASVMDNLFGALCARAGNFRAGIYWCHLGKETLHERVRALQTACGTNFFELLIDGFDELLVDLNARLASQDISALPAALARSRGLSSAPDEAPVGGIAAQICAVDGIWWPGSSLAANGAFGGLAAIPWSRKCRANSRRHARSVALRTFSRTPCSLTAFTTRCTCGWGSSVCKTSA